MAEQEDNIVGTAKESSGDSGEVNAGKGAAGASVYDDDDSKASAESKGTIGSGAEDTNLSQAGGGAVD